MEFCGGGSVSDIYAGVSIETEKNESEGERKKEKKERKKERKKKRMKEKERKKEKKKRQRDGEKQTDGSFLLFSLNHLLPTSTCRAVV